MTNDPIRLPDASGENSNTEQPKKEEKQFILSFPPPEQKLLTYLNTQEKSTPKRTYELKLEKEPAILPPKKKRRQKKKRYIQDWKAYDRAKTQEVTYVRRMLEELLLFAVPKSKGEKGFSKADKLFCMAMKIYHKHDIRKCRSMLIEMQKIHQMQKIPCVKSIGNFFNDKSLTKILDDLILISALPTACLEKTGAVDSTGITTSRYESWSKFKWGKHSGKAKIWNKLHLVAGCKSNCVISCEVTKSRVADPTMLEKIMADKLTYFEGITDLVADRAYSSRAIFDFIHKAGINPIIPFKINARSKPKGSNWIWSRMFHEFHNNQEAFMKRYHLRSNIESSIHSLKARLGHNCASKKFTAQVNEIKTKALIHNLCCLTQEIFESNIKLNLKACVNRVIST